MYKGRYQKLFPFKNYLASQWSKTEMQSIILFFVSHRTIEGVNLDSRTIYLWLLKFTPLPCIIDLLDEGVVLLPECHPAPVLSVVWCRTAVLLSCRYWELELHPALCWQDTKPARSVPVIFIIYYLAASYPRFHLVLIRRISTYLDELLSFTNCLLKNRTEMSWKGLI